MRNNSIKAQRFAAGNWKMNLDLDGARDLAAELAAGFPREAEQGAPQMILAVPFPFLHTVFQTMAGHPRIHLAAQNMHPADKGAFTGEISGQMLKSVGATHVLIGHSERRQYFHEESSFLLDKVISAIRQGLTPIYCFGETLAEREAGETFDVIRTQLDEVVLSLGADDFAKVILAYEPVWAIGTGKTATPEQAQEVHAFVRKRIFDRVGEKLAMSCPILYGGSVTAANAYLLFACLDIDGGLVGGASLKSADFLEIAQSFL